MDEILRYLLTAGPRPGPELSPELSLEGWWSQHRELASRFPTPVDVAFAGGFRASAAVHVALGGVLELCQRLVSSLEPYWAQVDAATRELWERDKPLLSVAGRARAKRREVARQRLAGG